jgi:DNA-directed RNA polymerase
VPEEGSAEAIQASERKRLARLLDGRITRKIVKQTVMTSVYGVTMFGAKEQILNRLLEVHQANGFGETIDRDDLPRMAAYLADLTLGSLNENFKGAAESMKWLIAVANRICTDAKVPVEWTTPLGWPVVQPYFRIKQRRVRTMLHTMTILESEELALRDDNTRAPVNKPKQVAGLPPNYVHSLDSSHMLMTASKCREAGLTFAAVHDSFWTHACDVSVMNSILRDQFVRLHQSTDLDRLAEQMQERYCCERGEGRSCAGWETSGPCTLEEGCRRVRWELLPPPPPPGDLDINVVRDSTYFFS